MSLRQVVLAGMVAAILLLGWRPSAEAACASTSECASKIVGYAVLQDAGLGASKIVGYAVLEDVGLGTSKINGYAVLCCVGLAAPKVNGYAVLTPGTAATSPMMLKSGPGW